MGSRFPIHYRRHHYFPSQRDYYRLLPTLHCCRLHQSDSIRWPEEKRPNLLHLSAVPRTCCCTPAPAGPTTPTTPSTSCRCAAICAAVRRSWLLGYEVVVGSVETQDKGGQFGF